MRYGRSAGDRERSGSSRQGRSNQPRQRNSPGRVGTRQAGGIASCVTSMFNSVITAIKIKIGSIRGAKRHAIRQIHIQRRILNGGSASDLPLTGGPGRCREPDAVFCCSAIALKLNQVVVAG